MEKGKSIILFIASCVLSVGLIGGGVLTGYYYYKANNSANFVVVKGLAEKEVRADFAIWDLKYVSTGTDILVVQQKMQKQQETIVNYLQNLGFDSSEITINRLDTNDLTANPYNNNANQSVRFILNQSITVKSTKVDLVASSLTKLGDLIAQGIIFDSETYSSPVSYIFTKLNDIKPEMLSQAVANAKVAAMEFAKSSGANVGKIHRAQQGVFSILGRVEGTLPESQQIDKKVRVVSTLEFYLD